MPVALNRFLKFFWIPLFTNLLLSGCDSVGSRPQGTTTGNAIVSIEVQSEEPARLCFDEIIFNLDSGGSRTISLEPRFFNLSLLPQKIGDFEVALQRHASIEIRTSTACPEDNLTFADDIQLKVSDNFDPQEGRVISFLVPRQDEIISPPGSNISATVEHLEVDSLSPVAIGSLQADFAFLTEMEIKKTTVPGGLNFRPSCTVELNADNTKRMRLETLDELTSNLEQECEGTSISLSAESSPILQEESFSYLYSNVLFNQRPLTGDWDYCALRKVETFSNGNSIGVLCDIERTNSGWVMNSQSSGSARTTCSAHCMKFADTAPNFEVSLHEANTENSNTNSIGKKSFCALSTVDFESITDKDYQCDLDSEAGEYVLTAESSGRSARCKAICIDFPED